MQNIFDSHAHYDDPRFDGDRDALLCSMAEHGVRAIMNVGNTTGANLAGIELARRYDFIYCSIGIHPDQSAEIAAQHSREYLDLMAQQLSYEKAMALGEIGLDYYYDDNAPRETQRLIFEQQLALAKDLDVPVIIHNRDAHQDTLELLKKYRPKGIMHCFSGSAEVAKEVLKLGMYIGFTGVITFKNARRAVEAAAEVPLDRLPLHGAGAVPRQALRLHHAAADGRKAGRNQGRLPPAAGRPDLRECLRGLPHPGLRPSLTRIGKFHPRAFAG